ncbi:glycoside hydrolase family 97 protein [Flavobacterium johnsoniae]|uniref:glycoside hydrolase family 97 protein n=1 Tax=Flavobacterium johnsoniae TaxID=986 RepID=UPI0011EC55F3|nr:glycoside hydrolase family 97 protein [Flavobacterium johnsoniae]
MKFKTKLIVFVSVLVQLSAVLSAQSKKQSVTITSPDKKLVVKIEQTTANTIEYTFRAEGHLLIQKSRLGLEAVNDIRWNKVSTSSVKSVWKPIWGKRKNVPDHYNQTIIDLTSYQIKVRVYNDGMAFRYEGSTSEKELTEFNFADNYSAWYYNGEQHNIGPEKLHEAADTRKPVMVVKAAENSYMAVHEANLESGEPLLLQPHKGTNLFSVPSKNAKAWRVVMHGRTPGELIDSHLIELLNPEPVKNVDFSWVKPGVAVWDWRIDGAAVDGFKYEMSLESWKRMVDLASANGMKSLVLDANWYGEEFSKESDPLKGGKVQQVHQIIAYGKEKNIGIWLYLNDVGGKNYPLEKTLKQYGDWGASGVKYGFMQGSPEEKNAHTQYITKLCAENHLMVDFHDDPVHPYGQMRTWPNAVTREFCQAQLDARRVFQPKTFVTSVFVNMVAGPLDMNNGTFDMEQKGRVDNPMPVPSTLTAEAARTLITFSGATIIPDIPENYNKYPELLQFISAQKQPWQESKTISGQIGEYIVMARQNAEGDWLIAAATNEESRQLHIPLTVLEKGNYKALIVQDADDADFRTNKVSHKTISKEVNRNDLIPIKLAPGGGACILLQKEK